MGLINLGEPFAQLVGTGITTMGIMNWMGSDSGDDASQGSDGGDDPFGGGGGDDLFGSDDDFGGGGDDPFGGGGGDDPFGGGDDAFGGDGGGAATEELENRLDDLESEVAQLSSSVNTVRSENEEIAESVGETEENVRKLLEIYEMVTRGVNPFVDEAGAGGGGSFGGGGDFGLFGAEEAAPQTEDDLDPDVTDADADSFFDDDAFDDADDDFDDADDEFGEFDDFEEDADDDIDAGGGTSGGGSTFEDLKAEYDSGDADWADEDSTDGAAADVELDGAELDESGAADDADGADDEEFGSDIEFELGDADDADDGFELAESDPDDEFEYAEAVDPDAEAGREPYLSTLPDGYLVDLVVLEWLDSLVTEFGADNAVRAVDYYVEIDWLSESVGDHLMVYLEGLTEIEPSDDLTGPAEMDVDDHVRSLTFITKLAGDGLDRTTIERRVDLGGLQHGLQC